MEVKLRLRKVGKISRGHYNFRIVACSGEKTRDCRFLEELGCYDPTKNPPLIKINKTRVDFWLKRGAQPSDTVRSLLKKGQMKPQLSEQGEAKSSG